MKAALIPALAACLAFASCASGNTDAAAQAQVDSIVASKTEILESKLRRNNDSIINALAAARADSILHRAPAPAPAASTPVKDTAAPTR